MVYYRSLDHLSHFYWKFWQPRHYGSLDPEELAEKSDWIPAGYERFDRLVGEILQASPDANVLIVSDHGFHHGRERLRVFFDMDRLLHHLGYLEWNENGVDMERSEAFTHRSTEPNPNKLIRLALEERGQGGRIRSTEKAAFIERLRSDLEAVRYESGEPVLRLTTPLDHIDAELRARVLRKDLTSRVLVRGKAVDDVVLLVESVSGVHKPGTPGVLLAAGPDIDPDATLDGISIFDITPTVLYGLGLPVAKDFAGRPWTTLFTEEFQRVHPLQKIDSWKMAREGELRESEADAEIIEELKALGYLQ